MSDRRFIVNGLLKWSQLEMQGQGPVLTANPKLKIVLMNFLFAWRYFKAKKSTNAINVIAWISMVAIMSITFAFIVVLSVFNGFEGLVKSLYSSFYPHVLITPQAGNKTLFVSPEQLKQLTGVKDVVHYSGIIEEKPCC
ncbi:hypothetical protein [Paraflavitalea speifideaquila]|uniref:hypothetical protein n=1 Tax=Paraflavitalea speifideaquila TaxID=3076558 RepID=UPI0028E29C33|nr:hypothetical protein [Paraflavitalea speifideiaquila]